MSGRKFYITVDKDLRIIDAGVLTEMAGKLFAATTYPHVLPERLFNQDDASPSEHFFFSSEAQWRSTFIRWKSQESCSNVSKS